MIHDEYYDLDCILSEEERFPLVFQTDGQGLGFLDCTNETADLQKGTKVELPAWLATDMCDKGFVKIEAPKCYMFRFRTFLLADPVVVNLRERSPHFYETGICLAKYVRDSHALCDTLVQSLARRFIDVLDKSQNSCNEDLSYLTKHMTDLEQRLFHCGHWSVDDLNRWKQYDTELIANDQSRRKRRRLC